MKNHLRLFTPLAMLFVTIQIASNLTAQKLVSIGPVTCTAAIVIFPISYIFGDIITEVYGYARSRQLIWAAFLCNLVLVLGIELTIHLPASASWHMQKEYADVLGSVPRMVLASLIAMWTGEFTNAYVLAKIKVWTNGRYLWMRTIGSSATGVAVDSVVWVLVAFVGVFPLKIILMTGLFEYAIKVSYEIIATPLTYLVVGYIKRTEHTDVYDTETKFNPFSLSI